VKKSVSIIGGGSAAIALASFLDPDLFEVIIYEKNKTIGRKFLVAGKGGFNLTHSEPINDMIKHYSPSSFLEKSLMSFSNEDFRAWLEQLGIPTMVGSSRRVYPKGEIKPIEVLDKLISNMFDRGVSIEQERTWTGWNRRDELVFNKMIQVKSDVTVFALGGASWSVTGSDGTWLDILNEKGVKCVAFEASNCAFGINWPKDLSKRFAGEPLKNIALTCNGLTQKGEVVLSEFGLEGNAIYALSRLLRDDLNENKKATLSIDLKPMLSEVEVLNKLEKTTHKNTTDALRTDLKLSAVQLAIVKSYTTKEEFLNLALLASKVKSLAVEVTGIAPVENAISTVGGVDVDGVDDHFQLIGLDGHYCIGEMLNWDAPTGGYLLQACFSMGKALADHLNETNQVAIEID
jgi:uncharacterized flavoprotein (TIGR03862 family)